MGYTEQEITHVNGVLRVCCSLEENLIPKKQSGDLTVNKCRVCDRKHYVFSLDPGLYRMR